ncbi:hypothetical protein DICPUDRAFT_84822 [Dictyostelium purpureum]|uniref:Terpene synthase 7 n=1 Tax=Dictyostelium purpureum TaxID=5786 RepID=TPS7_DICPU|nr:uncharacterized protein DICPUDRAFT_84822 [Dictyostelium purpureum]F1A3V1.1 RecName: Full=Terpene synthase 7 [Dictyostelium purpureum]AXN72976.1 terpene synthase [Dictyostelium purpureum]EGC29128.1 hypothetical protein DICPUDRAFT_84822 [Dictyostelium purpureum]|eukprot:XP_003294344.1 hypothetical protein DICPUDRAFT_84822 [Dictyostelium purpureum]
MQEKSRVFKWDINDFKEKSFKKPTLNLTWDYKFNPHYDEILINENIEWLKGTKLFSNESDYEKFISLKTSYMNAYLYSHGNREVFRYINRLNEYIYIIDDLYLEDSVYGQEWVNQLFDRNSKLFKEDHGSSFLWQIFDDIRSAGNSEATDYLIKKTKEWMDSVILFNSKEVHSNYTFEEYSSYRGVEVGMIFALACTKVHLPPLCDEIENHPLYIELLGKYFNSIQVLINDIHSFNKEIKSSRLGNYVKIAAYQLGSIQSAMDHSQKICNDYIEAMEEKCLELESIFPNNKDLETHLYLIKTIIAGNYYGSKDPNYPRYNGTVCEADYK